MSALTYATAQLLRVLPRARVSRAVGKIAESAWPDQVGRAVVSLYSRAYDVALNEAQGENEWGSFDAFFTRTLKDGARPIASGERVVVSPSDGRVDSAEEITADGLYVVKGRPYKVSELVGGEEEAKRYVGGRGCVIYLSPRDYHRVHSPVDGELVRIRSMPGDYFPVNAIGVKHVPNLFVRNRRVSFEIDTSKASGLGRVTLVMVSAMIVGRITASAIEGHDVPFGDHNFDKPIRIARGDEVGIFHLGSTCVLFLEKRAAGKWAKTEGMIRYGEPLHVGRELNGGTHVNGAQT
ncbi:MAG: archaetidylserine decarboxylase [Polyangiaceae bacterium]